MKYALGVLGVIIVAVLAILLITRKPGEPQTPVNAPRKVDLTQENTDGTSLVYTTYGTLVGQDQRRGIRITVSQDERRIEMLTGYESTVSTSQIFENTPIAYQNFLSAIKRAGFIKSQKTPIIDELGVCPLGQRYSYDFKDYGEEITHLWSTSCAAGQGSFAGSPTLVRTLFQKQIPDYSKVVSGINLAP